MASTIRLTPVEAGHKVQLPDDWVKELGLGETAVLEKSEAGVLVRPYRVATWDQVFADKLQIEEHPSERALSDVAGDDLVF
ncbi:MAG: hypothetical protein HY332_08875 [Chloroflexi bacterium]|nr:hypothetical protein [Chloroflexota bacterium]